MPEQPYRWQEEPSQPDILDAASQDPADLERIADLGNHAQVLWTDAELGGTLREQLDAPLRSIEHAMPERGQQAETLGDAVDPEIHTIGEALVHTEAPLPLLALIKEYGKITDRDPSEPIPQPVARTIYYAAIAAALVQHHECISTLPTSQLIDAMTVGRPPWIGPTLSDLVDGAAKRLRAVEGEPGAS